MPPTPKAADAAAESKPVTLHEALLATQKDLPAIQRDAINPHFRNKYISLDSLMPKVLPIMNENGLILIQAPSFLHGVNGEIVPALTTTIVHASGEKVETVMPLLLDKQNSQGQGSAITYARRYALLSMLGLVADQDDDGQSAAEEQGKPEPASAEEVEVLVGLLLEEGRSQAAIDEVFGKVKERNRNVLPKSYVTDSTARVTERLAARPPVETPAPVEPPAEEPAAPEEPPAS